MNENEKEALIWKIAKDRVRFKKSLLVYVTMNCFFWLIWLFTKSGHDTFNGIPWPIWSTLGWGIGIIMQYINAYHNKTHEMQKEVEKLRNEMR